jgi:hypothetical protein
MAGGQLSLGFREDSPGCDIPLLIPDCRCLDLLKIVEAGRVTPVPLRKGKKAGQRKAQSSGFAVWHHMDGV